VGKGALKQARRFRESIARAVPTVANRGRQWWAKSRNDLLRTSRACTAILPTLRGIAAMVEARLPSVRKDAPVSRKPAAAAVW
jgi:hypothetical protein